VDFSLYQNLIQIINDLLIDLLSVGDVHAQIKNVKDNSLQVRSVFGIWNVGNCVPFNANDSIFSGVNVTAVRATQILCIISAVVTLTAVAIFTVHLLTERLSLIASGIVFSFSAIFIMAALTTWTHLVKADVNGEVMHYGWAFGIGWCCFPLLLLLAGLALTPSKGKYETMQDEL